MKSNLLDVDQVVIPILGMHRSGTSMVTRILHHMGVALGYPLQPPAPDNPRGFWENRFFQGINMQLLERMGCHTDGFDKSVVLKKTAHLLGEIPLGAPLLNPVADYLEKTFKGGHWGFKDPRSVITWPFWKRVFQALNFKNVRPLVVLRHPNACARSLLKRGTFQGQGNKSPEMEAAALWGTYYKIIQTYLTPDILVVFQEDLTNPETVTLELVRIARYLGLNEVWAGPGNAAIEGSLITQRSPVSESIMDNSASRMFTFFLKERDRGRQEFQASLDIGEPLPESTPEENSSATTTAFASQKLPFVFDSTAKYGVYSLYIVSPDQCLHSHAFDEIALCLHYAFRQLGYIVPIVRQAHEIVGRPIVLGAHLLEGTPPVNSIIYNLEQIQESSPWMSDQYLELLKAYPVWDYSERNREALAAFGIKNVQLCKVGYVSQLSCIPMLPESERDIDVLFYGSINERRQKVLQDLVDQGVSLVHHTRCYGPRRDRLIARARIVVNLHYYSAKIMEVVRLSYLLANGAFVVSERGEDRLVERDFEDGMAFCDYEDLVKTCLHYLKNGQQRSEIAARGKTVFSAMLQKDYLQEALAQTEQPV